MFGQSPYECRVEWGQRGATEAADRGDITIIVDVLSFSSTAVVAVNSGACIFPFPPPINEKAKAYAEQIGAQLVWGRVEAERLGGHSLSPLSFGPGDRNQKFVMCSLNGAACVSLVSKVPAVLVGCLLNASAVSNIANELQSRTGANITVIPCGERWPFLIENENNIRPGIEDYLGAGMILSKLQGSKSAEARVCMRAYKHQKANIEELIWDCGSGRELRERGYAEDVIYCSQQDIFEVVPMLYENRFINAWERGALN